MFVTDYLERLKKIDENSSNLAKNIESIHGCEKRLKETCKTFDEEIYDKIYTLDESCESSLSRIGARQVKINNIREILSKCEISVTFVGGVSTGKSKIINSILKEEVLPSSIGVTTTKIVRLIGSNQGRSYIKDCDIEFKDSESLYEEVMNVSTDELDDNDNKTLIEVVITNQKKSILNDKTFLIDTPGYNGSDRAKELVMEICQVSDIIVFVMTYVFSDEEKEIFKLISQKTSKLNLFILVNKWDDSDSDELFTVEMCKDMIEGRFVDWFQDYNDTERDTAKSRIFFISAKEQMDSFMEPEKEINEFRKKEFKRFLVELEKSLSDPTFCKCLKHEQDIINMEKDMAEDVSTTINDLFNIINSRSKSLSELSGIRQFIMNQELLIKEKLIVDKEAVILEIRKNQKSYKSWFLFSDKPNKEVNNLKINEIVIKFDEMLNDLEIKADIKISSVVDHLQRPQLEVKDLNNSASQYPGGPVLEATHATVYPEDSTKRSSTKSKNDDGANKAPTVLEAQVLETFDDFNQTITTRCQLMLSKTDRLSKVIGETTNELMKAQQIFQQQNYN